jgi:hypothetical protein
MAITASGDFQYADAILASEKCSQIRTQLLFSIHLFAAMGLI